MIFRPGQSRESRHAEILAAAALGPVQLTSEQIRSSFKSGPNVREWAKSKNLSLTVGKGFVAFTLNT